MENIIIFGFATAMITCYAILSPMKYSGGPFVKQNLYVDFGGGLTRNVGAFDYFRRLFGVYKIEDEVWSVEYLAAGAWVCTYCLSFWVAFLFSVPYAYINALDLFYWFGFHLYLMAVSIILNEKVFHV